MPSYKKPKGLLQMSGIHKEFFFRVFGEEMGQKAGKRLSKSSTPWRVLEWVDRFWVGLDPKKSQKEECWLPISVTFAVPCRFANIRPEAPPNAMHFGHRHSTPRRVNRTKPDPTCPDVSVFAKQLTNWWRLSGLFSAQSNYTTQT